MASGYWREQRRLGLERVRRKLSPEEWRVRFLFSPVSGTNAPKSRTMKKRFAKVIKEVGLEKTQEIFKKIIANPQHYEIPYWMRFFDKAWVEDYIICLMPAWGETKHPLFIPFFDEMLRHKRYNVAELASRAMKKMKYEDVVSYLKKALYDTESKHAASLIPYSFVPYARKHKDEVINILNAALESKKVTVTTKRPILSALARIGGKKAKETLEKVQSNPNEYGIEPYYVRDALANPAFQKKLKQKS